MGIERLSARKVETAKCGVATGEGRGSKRNPGDRIPKFYSDGGGLYLRVAPVGKIDTTRSWVFRYKAGAKQTDLGLGAFPEIGLADARAHAARLREQRRGGADLLGEKKKAHAARSQAARTITFKEAADRLKDQKRHGWKGDASVAVWDRLMRVYAFPTLGSVDVAAITRQDVIRALAPHWKAKEEGGTVASAARAREKIAQVFDWATGHGYRSGDNPANWKLLQHALGAAPRKIAPVVSHAAMAWKDAPALLASLQSRFESDNGAARAIAFYLLTGAGTRIGPVCTAEWSQIDLANKIWNVPGLARKGDKGAEAFPVPLADDAIACLPERGSSPYVFPSPLHPSKPISQNTVTDRFWRERLGQTETTVHGLRSTFRDWCADTGKPREVAEAALAHVVSNAVEAAYQRSTMLDRRRVLMQQWAEHLAPSGANVFSLRSA